MIIGETDLDKVFNVFRRLETVSDIYILERLIASLCGIILRIGRENKKFCTTVATYMEDKYIKAGYTTHLLILDHIDTILHYSETFHWYRRRHSFDLKKIPKWEMDEECIKKVTGDGQATWGYGPIHMDFAKYTIGHNIAAYYEEDLPSLKEILAMIIWRVKELGYDETTFEKTDKDIAKKNYNYSRHNNSTKVERYGKKYSWIAFFELYGKYVLKGKAKTEAPQSFRVSEMDIDPTFPTLASKVQLITKCFLPRTNDDIQTWVNKNETGLLKSIYKKNDDSNNWILIFGRSSQEDKRKIRIDIRVNALVFPKDKKDFVVDKLKQSDGIDLRREGQEQYYLFNGEIPWGKLIHKVKMDGFFNIDRAFQYATLFDWYCWESYHSGMNDIGNQPFIRKEICDEFNFRYDIQKMAFFDNEQVVTAYYHDKSSYFYYINEDNLSKFLEKYELCLVWHEAVYKYGDFGIGTKKDLDPSFKRSWLVTEMVDC